MDVLTAARLEGAEAAAFADRYRAAPPSVGFAVEESPSGTALALPATDTFRFNRTIVLAPDVPWILAQVARYRALGLANFGIQVAPAFATPALVDALTAEGLAPRDVWIRIQRPAGPVTPAPSDLRIEPVTAEQDRLFGEIVREVFDMPAAVVPGLAGLVGRPGWHSLLAWDSETAVGCASLYVKDGVGWLGIAGTLPAARRRGAQSALIAKRLEIGTVLGVECFVAETAPDRPDKPNPSFHNAMRAGFTVAYERTNWLPSRA